MLNDNGTTNTEHNDYSILDTDLEEGKPQINGWVVLFALLNLLMGVSSLATLQKASATNIEMAKIRIVLQSNYMEIKQENILLKSENTEIKKQIVTINNRLENIEKLKDIR